MDTQESMNETLNDLVMINNDRIAGYEKAIGALNSLDIDLRAVFEQMMNQSKMYIEDLKKIIEQTGGIVEEGTTSAGKIYRAWMEIKSTFSESDRLSVLASCEFEESATLRAYESALLSGRILNVPVQSLVEEQTAALKKAYDLIKQQRNAHKALQY